MHIHFVESPAFHKFTKTPIFCLSASLVNQHFRFMCVCVCVIDVYYIGSIQRGACEREQVGGIEWKTCVGVGNTEYSSISDSAHNGHGIPVEW